MRTIERGSGQGNSNDHVRRHNLSTVLTLVHRSRGMSRSELTRQTGLNRSTIAGLVQELTERGLTTEQTPEQPGQVGRPSPVVMPSGQVVGIAINPEIDAVTIGVVSLRGEVLKRIRYDTDSVPTVIEAVRISAAVIEGMRGELTDRYRCVGIGIAVPGLVRARDGLVRLAPHLGWRDEPFAQLVQDATGYSVVAANDASLGAMGERIFGAGRGLTHMIYLNGGASGIGGGIIAGGAHLGGIEGYAGEFGHVRVANPGDPAEDPESGSLERMVNRAELLAALGLTAKQADELEPALLADRSPAVRSLVHRQLDFLSISLRNAINVLNPQAVVLGGFLGAILAYDPDYLTRRVGVQTLAAPMQDVTILRAELGSSLLMIGAAELAFQALLDDPAGF